MKHRISFPDFMKPYFLLLPESNPLDALQAGAKELESFFEEVPEDRWGFAYAPGKWTLAQVIGHMNDTERIFSYRALCIARGEQQALPGFDENKYAMGWMQSSYSVEQLIEEARLIRRTSVLLYSGLTESQWAREGEANTYRISPMGLAFATVGHQRHHLSVVRKRYLHCE